MVATLTGCLLGFLLGLRHAVEPDHLAAVSTLVAQNRRSGGAALLGAWWGVGHSLALFVVGGTLFLLRVQMPPRLSTLFELGVAIMLVVLGSRAILQAWRLGRSGAVTRHRHGGTSHEHGHSAEHVHVGPWPLAKRPLLIGVLHGLAGSGALTALVLAGMPTVAYGLTYFVLFGVGSIAGMALLTGILGVPLARLSRGPRAWRSIVATAGLFSLVMGVLWGAPLAGQLLGL